jgi:hypothetical protein
LAGNSTAIQVWPIDKLVCYAGNPRKNDAAVDHMCASIREFGFKIPLVRSDGEVIDGHLRLKAAEASGTFEADATPPFRPSSVIAATAEGTIWSFLSIRPAAPAKSAAIPTADAELRAAFAFRVFPSFRPPVRIVVWASLRARRFRCCEDARR